VYLILPGIFANLMPVLVMPYFKRLAIPVDLGKKVFGKRVFGDNKTYRGFVFGVLISIIVVYGQGYLYNYDLFINLSFIDYSNINLLLLGFLIGFGVLFGDLIESFFKRQLNIKPGESFFPFDQLDCLVGGLVFVLFVYVPSWKIIVTLFVLVLVIHVLIKHILYYLGLTNKKW